MIAGIFLNHGVLALWDMYIGLIHIYIYMYIQKYIYIEMLHRFDMLYDFVIRKRFLLWGLGIVRATAACGSISQPPLPRCAPLSSSMRFRFILVELKKLLIF